MLGGSVRMRSVQDFPASDVDQKLLGSRLFDGNVLDEPQHPLAVFSSCRWSVP